MVKFNFKQINYNKEKLESYFRDRITLLFRVLQKIEEFKDDHNKQLECVYFILNKVIEQGFTKKHLKKIEYKNNKFNFLPFPNSYKNSKNDHMYNGIHSITYDLISLSVGAYKKIMLFVDIKKMQDRDGNILEYEISPDKSYYLLSDPEYNAALHEDVSIVTNKNIKKLIQELKTYGRILSAEEVEIYATMDDVLAEIEYPDDFEDIKDDELSEISEPEENTPDKGQQTKIEAGQQRGSSASGQSEALEENEFNADYNKNTESYFLVKTEQQEHSNNRDESIDSILLMDKYLSWIYSLPEDLRQSFLNTAYVQELIASLKEMYNIINPQNIADKFSQLFEDPLEELHKNTWKYNDEISPTNELATNNKESDLASLPDISVIFEGDMSNMMMILPIMESGFVGLEPNFNAMELI
jgi:hypothetical protein